MVNDSAEENQGSQLGGRHRDAGKGCWSLRWVVAQRGVKVIRFWTHLKITPMRLVDGLDVGARGEPSVCLGGFQPEQWEHAGGYPAQGPLRVRRGWWRGPLRPPHPSLPNQEAV